MKKLLILAVLVAAPLTAHAEPAKTRPGQASAAGLDLRNPRDAAVMIQRIEAAVRPACVAPGFANRQSTAGCVRDLTRETVRNLNIPELTLALEQGAAPDRPVAQG